MKIYTKNGDTGSTNLVDGSKVSKADQRLSTYGGADELNSHLGMLISLMLAEPKLFATDAVFLARIQSQLFDVGTQLACSDPSLAAKMPNISSESILTLESSIDALSKDLPELKNFILPGGHPIGAQAHICRTVCRRVERDCVAFFDTSHPENLIIPFLNRLSDYFFVLSRSINFRLEVETPIWQAAKPSN